MPRIRAAHEPLGAVGRLGCSGRYVSFTGDIRDEAEFALWCRSLVPPEVPLLFGDEGSPEALELKPEATADDIFQLHDYVPPLPGWMNYTVVTRPGWELPPEEFARLLLQRWPEAHVELLPEADMHSTVAFRIPMAHSEVTGSLRRKVTLPDFTGDPRDCAEFALWCRSSVPAREHILCCERGNLPLKPNTTVQDILQALGSPPAS